MNGPCMDYRDQPIGMRIIIGTHVTAKNAAGGKPRGLKGNIKRPVIKLNTVGDFVAEYESIEAAANSGHFERSGVSKCCSGEQAVHKCFKWIFKENYDERKN